MSHTIKLDGHVWTRQANRCCLACGARTFRMNRRTATELIWARYPGTNGAHTFTREAKSQLGGSFVVCNRCFERRFAQNPLHVLAWEQRCQEKRSGEPAQRAAESA